MGQTTRSGRRTRQPRPQGGGRGAGHRRLAAVVSVVLQADMFGATEGRRAHVVRAFHRNGEGWLLLRDAGTGQEFESPDVFWSV